jgi:hypothetical protein
MDEQQTIKKRRGRGPNKNPTLQYLSVRLQREVVQFFAENYPDSTQDKLREILGAFVAEQQRDKTEEANIKAYEDSLKAEVSNVKLSYHTEGTRAFIVTEDGYTVCEVETPYLSTPAASIAKKLVCAHNLAVLLMGKQ